MFTPVPDRRRLLAQLSKSPQRYRRKKGDAPRQRGRKRNRDARNLMFDGWERQDFAQVGDWSIEQAMALPHFIRDRNGRPYLPALSPEWMTPEALKRILAIKRHFISLDEQQLPDSKEIRPWKTPVRDSLHFVGTFRRDTQDAIAKAFEGEFDHARGVSALEAVQYKLDPFMVDLVERVRPARLEAKMARKKARARDRKNRQNMLSEDIAFARVIGDRPFYMRHRCDFRGRVLQVPYLHMQRDEHVKSLFKFADGKRLGSRNAGHFGGYTDHEMLEIHCAFCSRSVVIWRRNI